MNYTVLLPGPEAQQLATYVGWLLHGTEGGLVAGTLFVLPGFASIHPLSVLYAEFREIAIIEAVFFGLRTAVLAVVVEAVLRIGERALENAFMVAIAIGAPYIEYLRGRESLTAALSAITAVVAFVLPFRFDQGMLRTLGASMVAGVTYHLAVVPLV